MGYKVLCHSVALFLCLLRSVHVRAQCTRPIFEGNVVLSDKDIIKDSFPDGSQATFACQTGYVPVDFRASKTVTCNGNKWTELTLICTRKSCGSLPEFPHGRYEIPDGILFGATVTGVCDKGYTSMRFGTNQRTCRADGWDGRAPECEAVTCLSPPGIENGQFEYEHDTDRQYVYGDGVSYKCNSGLSLVGSATLLCSENGNFQPEPPKCVVVSCPAPDVPNGYRMGGKAPPYSLNNFIEYACSDGYDVIGKNYILCTANGWSPKPPQCIGYCQPPVLEGHVTISKASGSIEKFHDGTNVTFECKSGYKPVNSKASNVVKCEGKQWTPLELTCKGEYCGPPVFGGNVTISKPFDSMSKFLDGSNVVFECKSGYEPVDLKASKEVTCVDTHWTNLQLTCKGYCGPPAFEGPVIIAKQLDSMNKFPEGSHLEFECKSGYEPVDLKAAKLVTCLDTKWTDLQLTCTGYCGPPAFKGPVIAKQLDSLNKFPEGSHLEFECKSGYEPVDLKAAKLVTCLDTKWTDLQLTCTAGLSPGAICGIVALLALVFGVGTGSAYYIKKKNSKHEYSHKVATRNEDL